MELRDGLILVVLQPVCSDHGCWHKDRLGFVPPQVPSFQETADPPCEFDDHFRLCSHLENGTLAWTASRLSPWTSL